MSQVAERGFAAQMKTNHEDNLFSSRWNAVANGGSKHQSTTPEEQRLKDSEGVEWRTKAQIADHFCCHIRTITKYMKRGILPYVKIGRWVRLDVNKCDAAIKKFETAGRLETR